MPNWITNHLIITGDQDILDELSCHVASGYGVFDFSKIIEPPKEKTLHTLRWNIDNWGTKWDCCDIEMNIHHSLIKAITSFFKFDNLSQDQSKIINLLESEDNLNLVSQLAKNVKLPEPLDFFNKDYLAYYFDTPWSTPIPVFKALSKKFKSLDFTLFYADEDVGSNCGVTKFKSGAYNDLYLSEGEDWKKESVQIFAAWLKGYSWIEDNE